MRYRKPKISIIVNCYNGEEFIRESIESILKQTYSNWEVIFWDNKSQDRSKEIFKSFRDKRLKYYYSKKHTSLYKARNQALLKATGEFISFLDTDDLWTKNRLKKQINHFKEKNIGLVYSNFWLFKENLKKKKLFKNNFNKGIVPSKNILINYDVGILTILIKKNYLLKLKTKFDERTSHIGDMDLIWKLSKICKFKAINEPLAYYRIHNNNLSSTKRGNEILELKRWIIKNKKRLNNDEIIFMKNKIAYKTFLSKKLQDSYIKCLSFVCKSNSFKLTLKSLIILFSPKWLLKNKLWF